MKGFAAVATAAILLVQVAAFMLVGTVSAAHTVTITPDKAKVKGGWEGVLTITVANAGPDAITEVTLHTIPDGWTWGGLVKKVPKDNIVLCHDDSLVILPAGTIVWLVENARVVLTENTKVVMPANKTVVNITRAETKVVGYELHLQVPDDVDTENIENLGISIPGAENLVDNFAVAVDTTFDITDSISLKLLEDTYVIDLGGNVAQLPENLRAALVAHVDNELASDNRVTPADNIIVTLTENDVRLVSPIPSVVAGWGWMEGDNLELADSQVIIRPGTVVQFVGSPLVLVPENTIVIRESGKKIDISTADLVENVPYGWAQDPVARKWTAIGDNKIPADGSEDFPFAIKAPTAAGTHTFYVRTKDATGLEKTWTFAIEVDNSIEVKVTVDKTWVGKNENITITVSSDEVFFFDNVIVRENNAPENTVIEMTTDDNKTYVGVYTTGENENRDGYLVIEVINIRDEVGNVLPVVVKDRLVFVDRRAPDPPSLVGLVPIGVENRSRWSVSITLDATYDNLVFVPEGYSPENLLLEVLVDNEVVASGRADFTGLVSFEITLTEGKHTIGARIIDKAGNVGENNVDNVYVDLSPPEITVVSPSHGAIFGRKDIGEENKITISVKFRDTVLGIENVCENKYLDNENFDRGWIVVLYKDGALLDILEPKVYPTVENVENVVPNVFGITAEYVFENELYLSNPTGKYNLVIFAGDSMNYRFDKGPHRAKENIAFEIDITPPGKPTEVAGNVPGGATSFEPTKTRASSIRLTGSAEPNATIQVWISVEGGAWTEVTAAGTTVGAEGSWSTTLDLTAYKGKSVGIKIRAVDRAGNEGEFYTYGYVLYDDSRPIVKIKPEHKQLTTDKKSVLIEGTVEKDPWETFDDIQLTVSPATAAIDFNRVTGAFTVSAPVTEGTNLITVEAVDPVGNRGSDTAVVTVTVTPWATYATILVVIALVLAAVAIFRKK